MGKNLNNLILGIAFWFLLTSPISENKLLKDYQKLRKDLYTKEFFECISEANKIKYVPDWKSHGRDYWQTPEETDSLGTGDCEDWAKNLQYLASQKGIKLGLWYGNKNVNSDSAHVCAKYSRGTQEAIIDRFANPDTTKILIRDSLGMGEYIRFDIMNETRQSAREYKKRTGKRFFN